MNGDVQDGDWNGAIGSHPDCVNCGGRCGGVKGCLISAVLDAVEEEMDREEAIPQE